MTNALNAFDAMLMFGYRVYSDVSCTRRIERRIPGGYRNRWLVRQVTMEPIAVVDTKTHRIFAHPTMVKELHRISRTKS